MDNKAAEFGTRQMQISTLLGLDLQAMQAYRTTIYEIKVREYLDQSIEADDFLIYFEHLKPWFANLWSCVDRSIVEISKDMGKQMIEKRKNWTFYCEMHSYSYYGQFRPTKEDLEALIRHMNTVKKIINGSE